MQTIYPWNCQCLFSWPHFLINITNLMCIHMFFHLFFVKKTTLSRYSLVKVILCQMIENHLLPSWRNIKKWNSTPLFTIIYSPKMETDKRNWVKFVFQRLILFQFESVQLIMIRSTISIHIPELQGFFWIKLATQSPNCGWRAWSCPTWSWSGCRCFLKIYIFLKIKFVVRT